MNICLAEPNLGTIPKLEKNPGREAFLDSTANKQANSSGTIGFLLLTSTTDLKPKIPSRTKLKGFAFFTSIACHLAGVALLGVWQTPDYSESAGAGQVGSLENLMLAVRFLPETVTETNRLEQPGEPLKPIRPLPISVSRRPVRLAPITPLVVQTVGNAAIMLPPPATTSAVLVFETVGLGSGPSFAPSSKANPQVGSGTVADAPARGESESTAIGSAGDQGVSYVRRAKLNYPLAQKKAGVSGVVRLRVLISKSGRVASVRVTESSGSSALDNAAISCARHSSYQSATRGGSLVDAWVDASFRFVGIGRGSQ